MRPSIRCKALLQPDFQQQNPQPRRIAHFSHLKASDWPWQNFSPDEPHLACQHCGAFWLDYTAMNRLQAARTVLGKPIRITSGHRCKIHNAHVGGAPRSEHKRIAFDISLFQQDPRDLFAACQVAGFTTFGFYGTFLHVDCRPNRHWFTPSGRNRWNFLLNL